MSGERNLYTNARYPVDRSYNPVPISVDTGLPVDADAVIPGRKSRPYVEG